MYIKLKEMTKAEAVGALDSGKIVTHRAFRSDNYIYKVKDGVYMDDEGFVCNGIFNASSHLFSEGWSEYAGRLKGRITAEDIAAVKKLKPTYVLVAEETERALEKFAGFNRNNHTVYHHDELLCFVNYEWIKNKVKTIK